MKWILEISDTPKDKDYPVVGFQSLDNGVKRGPILLKIEDVISALSSPLAVSQERLQTYVSDNFVDEKRIPTLPFGTVGYSFTPKGFERVTLLIEKDIWPVKYRENTKQFFIGFPRLLIQFQLVPIGDLGNRKITGTKMFAIQDNHQMVTNDTELYSFPFPNVEKTTGKVCWGLNSEFTISHLSELGRIFNLFLSAPFNEDYGLRVSNGILTFKDYLESEQDKPFNDELLLPITTQNNNPLRFGNLYSEDYVCGKCK